MSHDIDPLVDLEVEVSSVLIGSKRAVRVGGRLYVSPAMFDLMRHATPEELPRLLRAISVLHLPEPPSIHDPIELALRPSRE
jgi:hypothetical protein